MHYELIYATCIYSSKCIASLVSVHLSVPCLSPAAMSLQHHAQANAPAA